MTRLRWTTRPATPADVDTLCRFLRAVLPDPLRPFTIYASDRLAAYVADRVRAGGAGPSRFVLLTTPDGTAAGMAEWRLGEDVLFLNQLFVDPPHRRCGGARYLLAEGLAASSVPRIQLDVFETNTTARAWYDRLGFRPMDRRTWHHGPLPDAAPGLGEATMSDLTHADDQHRRYGFSTFQLTTPTRTYTVGRLGSALFRVQDAALLNDAAALHTLADLDPRRTLLYVGPASPTVLGNCLARSLRLEAPVEAVQTALASIPTAHGI